MKWVPYDDKGSLICGDFICEPHRGMVYDICWEVRNEQTPYNAYGRGPTPEAALLAWAKNNREMGMKLLELVGDALYALAVEEKETK